jgi:hypothetical protein
MALLLDVIIGIFHHFNPSAHIVALGLTQPLTEMSTRDTSWVLNMALCIGLTTLPHSCANYLEIRSASTSWNPKGHSRPIKW